MLDRDTGWAGPVRSALLLCRLLNYSGADSLLHTGCQPAQEKVTERILGMFMRELMPPATAGQYFLSAGAGPPVHSPHAQHWRRSTSPEAPPCPLYSLKGAKPEVLLPWAVLKGCCCCCEPFEAGRGKNQRQADNCFSSALQQCPRSPQKGQNWVGPLLQTGEGTCILHPFPPLSARGEEPCYREVVPVSVAQLCSPNMPTLHAVLMQTLSLLGEITRLLELPVHYFFTYRSPCSIIDQNFGQGSRRP